MEPEDILHVLSSQIIRFKFMPLAVAGRVERIHADLLGNIVVDGFEIQISSKSEYRGESYNAETLIHEIAHIHFGDIDGDDEKIVDRKVKEFLAPDKRENQAFAINLLRKVREVSEESSWDIWSTGSSWADKIDLSIESQPRLPLFLRIEKKIWPEFFDKVAGGEKPFEIQLADFKCRAGDILVLREWDPKTKEYTGRVLEKEITYVLNTKDIRFWSKEDIEKHGLQVIGLR